MPQSLANRLVHATIIWLVIALVLWAGWGWDDRTGFIAEPARPALLLVWLGLCWYGALANTRTSNACGKNEIRKHRQVFWFVLPVLIGWFVYLPYADRHQIATSSSAFLRWLGLAIFGIAYWLRIESIRAQGPQFSCAVAIQEQHRLTTERAVPLDATPGLHRRHRDYCRRVSGFRESFGGRRHDWTRLGLDGNAESGMKKSCCSEEFGLEFSRYARQTRKLIPFVY